MNEPKLYLKKIHYMLEASLNRALKKYGLTSTQFDILVYLADHPESQNTLTDISTYFSVRHTSAIHVLKILEKNGFIEKRQTPGARSKAITLTAIGEQAVTEIRQRGPMVSSILYAGLSESELKFLDEILHKIYTNLQSEEFQNL